MNPATFYFLQHLKTYKTTLSLQAYRTLKGQALAGDVYGASIGLERILQKRRNAHANAE